MLCDLWQRNNFLFWRALLMEDSNDKLFGILGYLGLLWLIPQFAGKTQFTKFHANQGFVLWLISIISNAVSIVFMFIPVVGKIIGGLVSLVGVGCFVLAIIGIVNVANGETKELPIVGKFHILDKNN